VIVIVIVIVVLVLVMIVSVVDEDDEHVGVLVIGVRRSHRQPAVVRMRHMSWPPPDGFASALSYRAQRRNARMSNRAGGSR
jgi:hypothetical protein